MPPDFSQYGSMCTGESEGAGLGVQTIVERLANGEHPPAHATLRLEHDDGKAGTSKQAGGPQPRQSSSHDDRRMVLCRACRGGAQREGGKGSGPRGLLEETTAVHGGSATCRDGRPLAPALRQRSAVFVH
jgi:hypothetical protein